VAGDIFAPRRWMPPGSKARGTLPLNFAPNGAVVGGGGGGRGGDGGPVAVGGAAASGASEPNGAVSLFDALTKQLGLKLEMQKRPMPVLVVDHIDEKPADN